MHRPGTNSSLSMIALGLKAWGVVLLGAQLVFAGSADAVARQAPGVPPNYSWNFATVTHPGNRAPNLTETQGRPYPRGSVDYAYRIATTEVTGSQWQEFLNAYAPYVGDQYYSRAVWGLSTFTGFSNGVPQYRLNEGAENLAVNVGWRFAARFVNWLHNCKALTRDAFQNGAYDTSTFGPADPKTGLFPDQQQHSAGAKYWIPTVDEWVKAAFYAPNRYGPGQEGYWQYCVSQDTPPVYGFPWTPGAQSAAGLSGIGSVNLPVGSYPNALSPWGLLDVSGGAREWLEDADGGLYRHLAGSWNYLGPVSASIDGLYDAGGGYGDPTGQTVGLRIASQVPCPAAAWAAGLAFLVTSHRKRTV